MASSKRILHVARVIEYADFEATKGGAGLTRIPYPVQVVVDGFGRQTMHGFRAAFSTWAHEVAEADPDVVEACLAHVRGNVRGIYNRAQYLSRRMELLQR